MSWSIEKDFSFLGMDEGGHLPRGCLTGGVYPRFGSSRGVSAWGCTLTLQAGITHTPHEQNDR